MHGSGGRADEFQTSHTSQSVKVSLSVELESVNEGHFDEISETTVCWSFRVLLTSLASIL